MWLTRRGNKLKNVIRLQYQHQNVQRQNTIALGGEKHTNS